MNENRQQRYHECARKLYAQASDLFHDGTEVLDAVRVAYAGIAHDSASFGGTRDLVDPMLGPSD